jgi:hypothetical protein
MSSGRRLTGVQACNRSTVPVGLSSPYFSEEGRAASRFRTNWPLWRALSGVRDEILPPASRGSDWAGASQEVDLPTYTEQRKPYRRSRTFVPTPVP